MRAGCSGCKYLNDWCSEYCRTYKEPTKLKSGQRIQFTNDIVDGYTVHALKGEGGELVKPYGLSGCEWIVYTNFGKRLKVNERQIELF